MPFYVGGAGDEGDVVEVDYLFELASEHLSMLLDAYPKDELEFWLREMSVFAFLKLRRIG